MGLVSRALENEGVATVIVTWHYSTKLTRPARLLMTRTDRGATLGAPGNAAQQRHILETTLELLAHDAPLEPVQYEDMA